MQPMQSCFRKLMGFYTMAFAICGALFLLVPITIIKFLNTLGSFQSILAPLEPSPQRFWVVLTVSMMVMITVLSYRVFKNPGDTVSLSILILSKATSSTLYFLLLIFEARAFPYLVGFIVDGVICLSFLYVKKNTQKES